MKTADLRIKLIESFSRIIKNDNKLNTLEGVFDAINTTTDTTSTVPESHYNLIEEQRNGYISGEIEGRSWETVKRDLKKKYGF